MSPTPHPSSSRSPSRLLSLFAAQVVRSPDATAVCDERSALGYRALDQRSSQLAHHLLGLGVAPGDIVAVQMERCPELLVALLAVQKAGAAYAPLDAAAPPGRRTHVLAATEAKVLLSHRAVLEAAGESARAASAVALVDVDAVLAAPAAARGWLEIEASPSDLLYVLFTSGTTGAPKGVMVEHAGVTQLLEWMAREYRFTAEDRLLQKTPYTFDASVWELFLPIISGGTVVMARPGGQRDPRYLVEAVIAQRITTLQLVPSMLRHLLEEPEVARATSLRHLFCGGEALTRELAEHCFEKLDVPLHNLYGPTETSVQVLTWTCRADELAADPRRYIPIGRPIDGVATFVLNEQDRPVPLGEVGELVIGGAAVARGYLGAPELTAQRFPRLPALTDGPVYCTGDRVRQHADGTFEFLGRQDDQVKIHGHRVELGEIEARLCEHAAVRHAAVVVERDAVTGRDQLVAYLEASPEVRLRELRSHIATYLPEALIPAHMKLTDRLPLSAHGKLDKSRLAQLPAVALSAAEGEEECSPRNDLEQTLADIWAELLGLSSVSIRDDFFELGGDSITCLMVIARAKQRKLPLVPDDLFKLRRIDKIARAAMQRTQPRS